MSPSCPQGWLEINLAGLVADKIQVFLTLCKFPPSSLTPHSFTPVLMSQAPGWALGRDTVVGRADAGLPREIRVQAQQTYDLIWTG